MDKTITIKAPGKGFYLITEKIETEINEVFTAQNGILNIFLKHSSAGITINENTDPDVRKDLILALEKIAPFHPQFRHQAEGSDDMPAHVMSTLCGVSQTLSIKDGKIVLGVWQGLYLGEFREIPRPRTLHLTYIGT